MSDVACDETGAVAAAAAACVDGGFVRCYSKSTVDPQLLFPAAAAAILQNLSLDGYNSHSHGAANDLSVLCVHTYYVSCGILVSRYHRVSTRPLRLLGPR